MIRRRDILAAAPAAIGSASAGLAAPAPELGSKLAAAMAAPVLKRELFPAAVPIESVQLLKSGPHYFVRARSRDGVCGYADAHSSVMSAAYPIVVKKVAPYFAGKNAVELESLLREVYLASSNYKWQGLPFWVSVAVVEIAILDLLGKVAGKPLGDLIGKVQRRQIAVYRASGNRGNSPEAEIDYLQKIVAETGASAIKFRLGARMAYNDASTRRDLAMIPLTRKVFGDKMAIYADGNGSYDVPMAIRIGRIMEQHKLAFLEEPAPFDYYEETKAIADALDIRIALGEEEASLRGFRSIIEHGVAQVIQPDILYSGGLIRAVKVARMAAIAGLECTVHMSGGGLGFLYVAHFASCIANPGPHQEYKGADDTLPVSSDTSSLQCEKGMLQVPTGPGLGVTLEPQFLGRAAVVSA
ncbi:MAG: mandelate racemase/muconate lactonizing enzyme family protein [Bryobacterales bacterium]|nr:mandelate racemase/muconate lactonizing enzyme family protein [Bryobacterales bacterium]